MSPGLFLDKKKALPYNATGVRQLRRSMNIPKRHERTGCGSVWWSTWFGTRGSQVRILSPRFFDATASLLKSLFLLALRRFLFCLASDGNARKNKKGSIHFRTLPSYYVYCLRYASSPNLSTGPSGSYTAVRSGNEWLALTMIISILSVSSPSPL